MTEHELQQSVFDWKEWQVNLTPPLALLYHIPNHYRPGERLMPGTLAGIPDIHLAFPYSGYPGLYIELKVGKAKPRKSQVAVMEMLKDAGYMVEVCYSLDEVIATIMDKYLEGYVAS